MQPGTSTNVGLCTDRSAPSGSSTRTRHATRTCRRAGTVLAAMVAGLPLALIATSQTPAAASPAPITIAYISSLTGDRRLRGRGLAVGLRGTPGAAERSGWHRRAQARPARARRPDQPGQHRQPGARGRLQGLRHRVAEPAVLPRREVPQHGGRPGDRLLRRRSRVGDAAQYEHVRLRRGERGPEVPRQHANRELPQGARRYRPRLVRLRHFALFEPRRHRHCRLVPARRGQGRGAQHLCPLRQRGLHQ